MKEMRTVSQLCPLIRLPAYIESVACQQLWNCGYFESLYILLSGSPCSSVYAEGDEMQPTKVFVEGLICTSPGCDHYVLLLL